MRRRRERPKRANDGVRLRRGHPGQDAGDFSSSATSWETIHDGVARPWMCPHEKPARMSTLIRQGVGGMNDEVDSSSRARDHMANERTHLAWLRTAANVMVVGLAIVR